MSNRKSSLTPTVITDRNGRITTVHKKDDASPAPLKRLPPPTGLNKISASLERTLTLAKRRPGEPRNIGDLYRVHALLADQETGESSIREQAFIALLDNRQTKVMVDALSKDGLAEIVRGMFDYLSTGQIVSFSCVYEPDLFSSFYEGKPDSKKSRIINKIWNDTHTNMRQYHALDNGMEANSDLSLLPPDKMLRSKAFIRLFLTMRKEGHTGRIPDEVVEFAISGECDIDDIAAVFKKTKILDPAFLRGVINGAENAVAQGWL